MGGEEVFINKELMRICKEVGAADVFTGAATVTEQYFSVSLCSPQQG